MSIRTEEEPRLFLRPNTRFLRPNTLLCFVLLFAGCDEFERVSHSSHGAYEASMTALPDGEGFAVAWYDDRDGNDEIYMRLLDAAGKPRSPEYRLTNDPELSYEADIHAIDRDLAVGWYERMANGDLRAKVGVWTQSGEERWTRPLSSNNRGARNTLVQIDGDEIFTAWIEDLGGENSEVWGQWWSAQGDALTPARRLAPASRTTWNLNGRVRGPGEVWIVFDAKIETRSNELFLLRATKSNADLSRLTADDGAASKYPDVVFAGDRAALTWFDHRDGNDEVYLFAGPISEFRGDIDHRSSRVTSTPGESMGAYIAVNGDRLGLAWCDNTPGQHEIYFQPFDLSGSPRADARRLTRTPTQSLIPSITAFRDSFALVWNEFAPKGPGHASDSRSEILFSLIR
jgi:hypothetical protein